MVFGPNITDNCVPMREAIEERFKVPAISVTGTDDWLGEWTFAFPQGSMTDEPIFLADLVAKRGLTEIGVLVEQSLIGESYLKNLRSACAPQGYSDRRRGRRSLRRRRTSTRPCRRCTRRRPRRSCTWGSDSGSSSSIPALEARRLGSAAFHHHRISERLGQPDHVERVHGLDRGRSVRRGQPDRTGLPGPVRREVQRQPSRVSACRWSIATSPPRWCARSPMRIR